MGRVLKDRKEQVTYGYYPNSHRAVDLVGYPMSLDYITAHSDGVVTSVRNDYKTVDKTGISYGNYVKLRHDNGYYTLYAHMSYGSVTVKVGDKVKKGQVLGYMGATGHTNGAHLHFEVRNETDVTINPIPYVEADLPNNEKVEDETGKSYKPVDGYIVRRTLRGDFGNGQQRKAEIEKLGYNFAQVQHQVNLNIQKGTANWSDVKIYF